MQRMRSVFAPTGRLLPFLILAAIQPTARADLIRAAPGRSFPDIAGDIGGSQTYVYDPVTQTGTFALINAPHLISLGPKVKDLVPMEPDRHGTLTQTLELKLDCHGRLVDSPLNKFEIFGTVVINDRVYEGLLLKGRPTAFGIADHDQANDKNAGVFGLNVEIEEGQLAHTFGTEAYLRIVPQANSTFRGEFTRDFSAEKPLTNLLALDRQLRASWVVPIALVTAFAAAAGLLAWRIARSTARLARRGPAPKQRPLGQWAAPSC
jgi:hypothetical protein